MSNYIVAGIVALLVVIGGGYYVMSSGSMTMKDTGDSMAGGTMPAGSEAPDNGMVGGDAIAPKAAAGAFTGSWNDLVKRGGNYVCEVNHSSKLDATTGKVYVSGTDVRGDFVSMVNGASVESHMLKKADTMYVWSSAMPQGMMMSATMMEGQGSAGATEGAGQQAGQSYDWNCSATGADAAMFVVPKDVQFMDMSKMMQGVGVPGTR